MRPLFGVVTHVDTEHPIEMPTSVDEDVVQAYRADGRVLSRDPIEFLYPTGWERFPWGPFALVLAGLCLVLARSGSSAPGS